MTGETKIFLKDTMVSKVSQQSHFRLCFWFYNLQRNRRTERITEFLVSVYISGERLRKKWISTRDLKSLLRHDIPFYHWQRKWSLRKLEKAFCHSSWLYKTTNYVQIQHRPIVNYASLRRCRFQKSPPLEISAANPWNVSLSLFGKKRE